MTGPRHPRAAHVATPRAGEPPDAVIDLTADDATIDLRLAAPRQSGSRPVAAPSQRLTRQRIGPAARLRIRARPLAADLLGARTRPRDLYVVVGDRHSGGLTMARLAAAAMAAPLIHEPLRDLAPGSSRQQQFEAYRRLRQLADGRSRTSVNLSQTSVRELLDAERAVLHVGRYDVAASWLRATSHPAKPIVVVRHPSAVVFGQMRRGRRPDAVSASCLETFPDQQAWLGRLADPAEVLAADWAAEITAVLSACTREQATLVRFETLLADTRATVTALFRRWGVERASTRPLRRSRRTPPAPAPPEPQWYRQLVGNLASDRRPPALERRLLAEDAERIAYGARPWLEPDASTPGDGPLRRGSFRSMHHQRVLAVVQRLGVDLYA